MFKKLKKQIFFLVVSFLALSTIGCNMQQPKTKQSETKKQEAKKKEEKPKITKALNITFTTDPKTIKQNKETTLKVTLQKDAKPVNDATIELEIWHKGDKKHQMINCKKTKDGVYTCKKIFKRKGEYYVTIHATTKETHQMVNEQLIIK